MNTRYGRNVCQDLANFSSREVDSMRYHRLGSRYSKAVQERKALEAAYNADRSLNLSQVELVKQRLAREIEVENEKRLSTQPVASVFEAYSLAKRIKASSADAGLRALTVQLERMWNNDRSASLSAKSYKALHDHYRRNFPKSEAAGVLEEIGRRGYATLPVSDLARIASGISSQADFEEAMLYHGLSGKAPHQVKARQYILALLNDEEMEEDSSNPPKGEEEDDDDEMEANAAEDLLNHLEEMEEIIEDFAEEEGFEIEEEGEAYEVEEGDDNDDFEDKDASKRKTSSFVLPRNLWSIEFDGLGDDDSVNVAVISNMDHASNFGGPCAVFISGRQGDQACLQEAWDMMEHLSRDSGDDLDTEDGPNFDGYVETMSIDEILSALNSYDNVHNQDKVSKVLEEINSELQDRKEDVEGMGSRESSHRRRSRRKVSRDFSARLEQLGGVHVTEVDSDGFHADDTLYLGVMYDGSGYASNACVAISTRHPDAALEGAYEMLEAINLDRMSPEELDEMYQIEEEEGYNPLTALFDGFYIETTVPGLLDFLEETDNTNLREKFADVVMEAERALSDAQEDPREASMERRADDSSDPLMEEEIFQFIITYSAEGQELYNRMQAIANNLRKKLDKGIYDTQLATQGFMYLVEDGLQAYARSFYGQSYGSGKNLLSPQSRMNVAAMLVEEFEESNSGNDEESTGDMEFEVDRGEESRSAQVLAEEYSDSSADDDESLDWGLYMACVKELGTGALAQGFYQYLEPWEANGVLKRLIRENRLVVKKDYSTGITTLEEEANQIAGQPHFASRFSQGSAFLGGVIRYINPSRVSAILNRLALARKVSYQYRKTSRNQVIDSMWGKFAQQQQQQPGSYMIDPPLDGTQDGTLTFELAKWMGEGSNDLSKLVRAWGAGQSVSGEILAGAVYYLESKLSTLSEDEASAVQMLMADLQDHAIEQKRTDRSVQGRTFQVLLHCCASGW